MVDPNRLAEAQQILIRCGALSYGIDQLVSRYRHAQTILAGTDLVHPRKMKVLLNEVMAPVQRLLDQVTA